MALLAVNRDFHSAALTLVCFGFRDTVSFVPAIAGLGLMGSPSFIQSVKC